MSIASHKRRYSFVLSSISFRGQRPVQFCFLSPSLFLPLSLSLPPLPPSLSLCSPCGASYRKYQESFAPTQSQWRCRWERHGQDGQASVLLSDFILGTPSGFDLGLRWWLVLRRKSGAWIALPSLGRGVPQKMTKSTKQPINTNVTNQLNKFSIHILQTHILHHSAQLMPPVYSGCGSTFNPSTLGTYLAK